MNVPTDLNLTQSRRGFIKAAGAVLLAGAGTAMLGGCSPKGAPANANDTAESVADIQWDEETDILIVGGGLAGQAAAAVVALEGNGAKALLLEKGSMILGDGDSPFSAGRVLWTDDAHAEGFRQYLYELRGDMDNTPDAVLDAYAAGVLENRSWLESLPDYNPDYVDFSEHFEVGSGETCYPEYAELPHSYNLGVLYFKDETYDHVIKFVNHAFADSENITHKLNAPLVALVQDPESKAILGGVYTFEGETIYVKANKGVIMCCGGFENNAQMRADYLSGTTARCIAGHMSAPTRPLHLCPCRCRHVAHEQLRWLLDQRLPYRRRGRDHAHAQTVRHYRRHERTPVFHGLGQRPRARLERHRPESAQH